MSRNVLITAADGQTGFLIAELLLTHNDFKTKVDSVTCLTLHPSSAKAKELTKLGAKVVPHHPGREREMVKVLKETGCDTICLIPPTHVDKVDITMELIAAARKADVKNGVLISSVGCDLAERDKQPRLREFIDIEAKFLESKGIDGTMLGQSPCVIRAGFYAENLLIYSQQAQKEGILPLPIGENHLFAPVALGDVAQLAAHVLTGKGENGLDDKHRGQLMVLTGPLLCTGKELAAVASEALGAELQFEDISVNEAKRVLHARGDHHDESEREYLLEYYSLVREGKTNYISTSTFVNVTGNHPQEPSDFFKVYARTFKPKAEKMEVDGGEDDGSAHKKRKTK